MFALVGGEVIGTCALLKDAPGVYQLTKMGVAAGWSGIGARQRSPCLAFLFARHPSEGWDPVPS